MKIENSIINMICIRIIMISGIVKEYIWVNWIFIKVNDKKMFNEILFICLFIFKLMIF